MELFKSLGKIILLPVAGYLAEAISMYYALFILGVLLAANAIVFRIRRQ